MTKTHQNDALRPFAEVGPDRLARIAVIAADIDDTLTDRGRLPLAVLEAVERLAARSVEVIPVTGRPAGLLTALVTFLPGFCRGVAENGSVLVFPTPTPPRLLTGDAPGLRRRLAACRAGIEIALPHVRVTHDLYARLIDLTFELTTLLPGDRDTIDRIAARHDLRSISSSIHLHLNEPGIDKARALEALLDRIDPGTTLTIGDSELDAALFDPGRFPLSVGVANVRPWLDRLPHVPRFVTAGESASGFLEVAGAILRARGAR